MTRPVRTASETRAESARRGWKKRRKRERVRPRDLKRLQAGGSVAESLRPLLTIAEHEAAELTEALGGSDAISAQERAVVEDFALLGIVLRAEFARFAQADDEAAGGRVGTLAGQRLRHLQALGLERRARDMGLLELLNDRPQRDAQPAEAPQAR